MAHYALLDENNVVIQVITGVDENETQIDTDGTIVGGSTEAWENFYATRPWLGASSCKRTSYNHAIRGIYAGIGCSYNEEEDIFVLPQPFPSWIRTGSFWNPPTEAPSDGKLYDWDEENQNWFEIVEL